MKFTEHLSAHLTPEWRKQYIDYEALKEILYKALDDFENLPVVDAVTVHAHFNECDELFFVMCEEELEKVNNFYAEKLAEAKRKFASLKNECDSHFASTPRFSVFMNASNVNKHELNIAGQTSYENISKPSVVHGGQIRDMDTLRRRRSTIMFKGHNRSDEESGFGEQKNIPKLKIHDLKLAFSEFYLSLVLLQNYQSLNHTGFRKILKKHDKLFQRANGLEWFRNVVSTAPFYLDETDDQLINETEDIYTNRLEGGNRQKAMKRLRVPPLAGDANLWSIFRFGWFGGLFLAEVIVIAVTLCNVSLPNFSWPAFRIFRSILLIIFYICCLGMNVYGWRSAGVNHVLIFEIDPRSHLDHFQLLELGLFYGILWGGGVIFFMYSEKIGIPPYTSVFTLTLTLMLLTILPFKIFQYKARRWIVKIFLRVFRAPFAHVHFPDFFVADQLNSLNFVLPDLAYFFCFFSQYIDLHMRISSQHVNSTHPWPGLSPLFSPKASKCDGLIFGIQPVLLALPAWWRFVQCLRRYRDLPIKSPVPHLLNAGKYSTTLGVGTFNVISALTLNRVAYGFMVLMRIINSSVSYTWDVVMDWGLLDRHSKENFMLRDELVYRFRAYYYGAIIMDLLIRFSWAATLTFKSLNVIEMELIKTAVMFLEVFRRVIWNFFRLENEHLNNVGNFRAVRDIFVTPIRKEDVRKSDKTDNVIQSVKIFDISKAREIANMISNRNNTVVSTGGGDTGGDEGDNEENKKCQMTPKDTRQRNMGVTMSRSNQKSLWRHLQEAYTRSRNERRRRMDQEVVSTMERELKAAGSRQKVKAENPMVRLRDNQQGEAEAELDFESATENSWKDDILQPAPSTSNSNKLFRKLSLRVRKKNVFAIDELPLTPPNEISDDSSEDVSKCTTATADVTTLNHRNHSQPRRGQRVMVNGREREACAHGTIPLRVCFLESPKMKYRKTGVGSVDVPTFPSGEPGMLLPYVYSVSGELSSSPGLDLVVAPEFMRSASEDFGDNDSDDDSPNTTMLPIRTQLIAKQLRSILRRFSQQKESKDEPVASPLDASSPTVQLSPIVEKNIFFTSEDTDEDEAADEEIPEAPPSNAWRIPWSHRSEDTGYRIMRAQTVTSSYAPNISVRAGRRRRSLNTLDSWVEESNSSSNHSGTLLSHPRPLSTTCAQAQTESSAPEFQGSITYPQKFTIETVEKIDDVQEITATLSGQDIP